MPEFKSKEEYEKWKAIRSKELGEKIEPEKTTVVENNKEEIAKTKAIESGEVRNDRNSNLRKIVFLILSILAFIGLFGIYRIALSPVGGFIVQLGFPFLIFVFSLLLIVLSFMNLLKNRMEHFALGIRILSIGNLILICSFVAFAVYMHSTSLNHYRKLAEENGRLARTLESSVNELNEDTKMEPVSRTFLRGEYRRKQLDAEEEQLRAESKIIELSGLFAISYDEVFGGIFVFFGNLVLIVLSFFSRRRS